jgi:uncharacterized NAD(P)/FAD-binding protein YdhS
MAPEMEARVTQAHDAGRLTLMAAKVIRTEPNDAGAKVAYRRRGDTKILGMQVGVVVDCTGIVKDREERAAELRLPLERIIDGAVS